MSEITLADIRGAAGRIAPYAHRTPVMTSSSLNDLVGAQIYLKCENLQKAGAFKFRGACNALFSLSAKEAARGVATHSSGNHAQALALAARLRGVPAYIVMPENASAVKKAAVKAYGGQITSCRPTQQDRESTLEEVVEKTGATVIHPYNDQRVIAGQGTVALELIEMFPHLDMIIAPVGGGGLISGTATAAKALVPGIRVLAAEPAMADDAYRSLREGRIVPSLNPQTVADGLRTSLGELTFPIIQKLVEAVIRVSEKAIIEAMRYSWERTKLIIEPSSAVALALLMEEKTAFSGLKIGVIISGGNVDLEKLPWQA